MNTSHNPVKPRASTSKPRHKPESRHDPVRRRRRPWWRAELPVQRHTRARSTRPPSMGNPGSRLKSPNPRLTQPSQSRIDTDQSRPWHHCGSTEEDQAEHHRGQGPTTVTRLSRAERGSSSQLRDPAKDEKPDRAHAEAEPACHR